MNNESRVLIIKVAMNTEGKQILEKLDTLIKVTVVSLIQGKLLKEQVKLLSLANLKPKEIADILGKKPNHISVILNELKKERGQDKNE